MRGCRTEDAKITNGSSLPAKWIVHTVGPVWGGGTHEEDELLASCYKSCLAIAVEYEIGTIAFPAISTGVYRFPLDRAAGIAVSTAVNHFPPNHFPPKWIFLCLYS